jgi:hypothetical protein
MIQGKFKIFWKLSRVRIKPSTWRLDTSTITLPTLLSTENLCIKAKDDNIWQNVRTWKLIIKNYAYPPFCLRVSVLISFLKMPTENVARHLLIFNRKSVKNIRKWMLGIVCRICRIFRTFLARNSYNILQVFKFSLKFQDVIHNNEN